MIPAQPDDAVRESLSAQRHAIASRPDPAIREANPTAQQPPIVQITTKLRRKPSDPSIVRAVHIIVFVHGYKGNRLDLALLKNEILQVFPNHIVLLSSTNEGDSDIDIASMGLKLSNEVQDFVQEWCPNLHDINKVSFIGHSLGGLVIRAALPHISNLYPKLNLYMSLSTPHLGYLAHGSVIVNTAMWLFKTWNNSRCLKQLTLSEANSKQLSFLYDLAQYPGFEKFRNFVLVSSKQDTYAPYESTRIELGKLSQDSKNAATLTEMVHNLDRKMSRRNVYRLDVDFDLSQQFINISGRAAHLQFLENKRFLKVLVYKFYEILS